ncbi:uncharacterized protein BDCG_04629 [Blastomyces dermatitidis ER-3]|uniref:OefB protein n=1 Tax=Ajellomyces dermatitidis (strain ER-3 / ATCC MYA-2586) TaxID=559297 RepID=A0ABP2F2R1_AJEDR|nr:uncharacterized protein BDCG_04629 [Blastomyces dermatitidis ER-3]EEQ89509.1 hypothetical protein BDCG_04629 [Blastomyces dermatitidis ER-3]
MAEAILSIPDCYYNNLYNRHQSLNKNNKPRSTSSSSSSSSSTTSRMWSGFSFSNSTFSSPSGSPSSSLPPPPPPSPNDSLLDIAPRKSSFSMTSGRNTSCAFPSWPNRSSLFSDSDSSASSYLSDEDLFPTSPSPSSESAFEEDAVSYHPVFAAGDLTTEEQISLINGRVDEEERRQRYLANAHAQLRAQQAQRAAQILAAEQSSGKRRKRRVVADKKRRTTSSSSSPSPSSASASSKPSSS